MRFVLLALALGLMACTGPDSDQDPAEQQADRDREMAERLAAASEKVAARDAKAEELEQCVADTLAGERFQGAMAGLEQSDDYGTRTDQLRRAGATVLCNQRCQPADVIEQGGWVRSQNRPGSYFIWCNERRVYLNGETGRIT